MTKEKLLYSNKEEISNSMRINENRKKIGLEKCIFCSGMIVAILVFLLAAYQTRGIAIQNLFFGDPNDTFMDFYKVIICGRRPYAMEMIYPPLSHAILSFMGHFVPVELIEAGPFAIRASQIGMGVFFGWMMISLYVFFRVFQEMYQSSLVHSENKFVSDVVLFCVLFSTPFIFCFERGNIIFLALICLMIYLQWYQSNNKLLRFIAFVALAVSAAIKVYPAIFGILLIRERKWKQASLLIVIGAVVFFSPFLLMEGESRSVLKLLSNINYTKNLFSSLGFGFRHDIANQFNIINEVFGVDTDTIAMVVTIAVTICSTALLFIRKDIEKWKVLALLVLLMILVTGFNYTYSLVFMVIPLIYFLNEPSKDCLFLRIFYSVLFVMIFMPIVIGSGRDILNEAYSSGWPLRIPAIIESCALFLMLLVLCVSETIGFIGDTFFKSHKK